MAIYREFAKGRGGDVHFIDSIGKKVRAIQEFCEELELTDSNFYHQRGEEFLSTSDAKGIDTVVMRAVAPPEKLLGWISPRIPRWVIMGGPQQLDLWNKEADRIKKLGFEFKIAFGYSLPGDLGERYLFEIQTSVPRETK